MQPSIDIATMPGIWNGPVLKYFRRWSICAWLRRRNSGELLRICRNSLKFASAAWPGPRSWAAVTSRIRVFTWSTLPEFSLCRGRPWFHLPVASVQSISLNQSPESKELRSIDFERRISVPACQNGMPWPSSISDMPTVSARTRSASGVPVACLYWLMSHIVSLSCLEM